MLERHAVHGQDVLLGDKRVVLRDRIRAFAIAEVQPHAARIDREAQFPRDIYRRAATEGLVGFLRPAGAARDTLEWALMMEEMGAASASVADILLLSEMIALILDEGSSEQQRELLGPLLAGEQLGAFALTEINAGSDAAAIETQAEPDGDDYILNGRCLPGVRQWNCACMKL